MIENRLDRHQVCAWAVSACSVRIATGDTLAVFGWNLATAHRPVEAGGSKTCKRPGIGSP